MPRTAYRIFAFVSPKPPRSMPPASYRHTGDGGSQGLSQIPHHFLRLAPNGSVPRKTLFLEGAGNALFIACWVFPSILRGFQEILKEKKLTGPPPNNSLDCRPNAQPDAPPVGLPATGPTHGG